MRRDILLLLTAAGLCCLLTRLIRSMATQLGAVDEPGGRHIHQTRIPRLGGLAVLVAFLGTLGISLLLNLSLMDVFLHYSLTGRWLLAGALLIVLVGVADDVWGLAPVWKLGVECVAAGLVVAGGVSIAALGNPFSGTSIPLGWLSIPVTVVWVVSITNAFNLIDGLDGLATGVALIAAVTLWAIAVSADRSGLAALSITLAGALAGFLLFNFHPASIFLGDSGSLFIGYTLAVLSLRATQSRAADIAIVIPILILGLPIFDMLLAVARRAFGPTRNREEPISVYRLFVTRWASIMQPDRRHIHHRLIAAGLSHRQAVCALYGVCVTLGITAFLVLKGEGWTSIPLLAVMLFLAYLGARRLGY